MTTRAREVFDRSRILLNRSRVAAAGLLDPPRHGPAARAIEAGPARTVTEPQPSSRDTPDALAGICSSVALRDLNLVDSLLAQLEEMEAGENDQDRLGELYQLDHLATRLRRNAENLRVLAGRDAGEVNAEPASLVDVVRAGMSSIEAYARVSIGRMVSLGVVGVAAEDLSRLLSELLDNATGQSPPDAEVRVSTHLTETGSVLIRIEDEGIGMPPERLDELNERLSAEPVLDDVAVRHMGLAVVRRLATRHGMRARLERRVPHGTTATVLLPAHLVCELPEAGWSGSHTVVPPMPRHSAPAEPAIAMASPSPIVDTAPTPRTPSPLPRRQPAPTETGGTTASGLPRRVSRSIKNADITATEVPDSAPGLDTSPDGHDQLLADLDAFSDGQQQARDAQSDAEEPSEGTQQ